jgi:negative regulator of flagellin synthesis FlgM
MMTINSLNGVTPLNDLQSVPKHSEVKKSVKTDSVTISPEALAEADFQQAKALVVSSPDIPELSPDMVNEYRAKINDPSYLNEKLLYSTADILLAEFGL